MVEERAAFVVADRNDDPDAERIDEVEEIVPAGSMNWREAMLIGDP